MLQHSAPPITFQGISKAFGPVEVLHDVTFEIAPGEVHALLGEIVAALEARELPAELPPPDVKTIDNPFA